MYKIIFILLLTLTLLLSHISDIHADALRDDQKTIGSYVRFEGWENVSDYWIVQPIMADWGECEGKRDFNLLNSGDACNFGSESKCMGYSYPAAISKIFTSDIHKEIGSWGEGNITYSVNCNSDAYKNAIVTKTEIPHTHEVVSITNNLMRKDYIVTFEGVDEENNELIISVSDPIIRYTDDKEIANSFVESLTVDQVLDAPFTTPKITPTPTEYVYPTVKLNITKTPQKEDPAVNDDLYSSLDINWLITAGFSLFFSGGVLGFVVGKKSQKGHIKKQSRIVNAEHIINTNNPEKPDDNPQLQ
ncbi:hypothetical protein JXA63_00635 [Candidatus Woesebacteria bacterium]|nr:hypothetical protein [Candidatus Woesebacteria bacterium]